MAKLKQAFDADQHGEMRDFKPIPKGEYVCQISDSDVCKTKDKTGEYIKLEFSVLDGEFKGRKIWTNLNIINKNPIAVEIAEKEFATICRCVGKTNVQDTQVLHGIPLKVHVGIKPEKGEYAAQNIPRGYEAVAGAVKQVKKAPAKTTKQKKAPVETEGAGWD